MLKEQIQNSTGGDIYYGMHFYPGVVQYQKPGEKEFKRYFINEDTIRKMDATFAGKPVYAFDHVPDTPLDIDQISKDADGWVIESFFNEADGKHWVKFIVTSKRGKQAIQNGLRLSNAYDGQLNGMSGEWNGVPYNSEVIGGEHEHLALVDQPRYDESVVMTPDQFKAYNAQLKEELVRIANSKEKQPMTKLKFWNRKPVEQKDQPDLETLSVTLPKSGKEYTLIQLVNAMDEVEEKKAENMADEKAMVKMHDGKMCNVGELVAAHKDLSEKHEALKSENAVEEEGDLVPEEEPVEVEGDLANEDDESEGDMQNADEKPPKEEKQKNKDAKDPKDAKDGKMANSKDGKKKTAAARKSHFESLKNAAQNAPKQEMKYESSLDQCERGRQRYGSH